MRIEELASEVAKLDRASKTAKAKLDQAKEKMMAQMDEHDITKFTLDSGRATITLVDAERLDVDYETLNELDSEIGSKVRVEKVDIKLFKAGLEAGLISTDLAKKVSSFTPYRQIKVTRK